MHSTMLVNRPPCLWDGIDACLLWLVSYGSLVLYMYSLSSVSFIFYTDWLILKKSWSPNEIDNVKLCVCVEPSQVYCYWVLYLYQDIVEG